MKTELKHAENVRDFYREQGARRERERIIAEMNRLLEYRHDAQWSPAYIIKIIERTENASE